MSLPTNTHELIRLDAKMTGTNPAEALMIEKARLEHLSQWPASINELHGYDLRVSAERIAELEAQVAAETTP